MLYPSSNLRLNKRDETQPNHHLFDVHQHPLFWPESGLHPSSGAGFDLIQLARTTVLLYGPRYYREGKTIIERKNAETDHDDHHNHILERDAMINRNSPIFYTVTTFYDQTKELFEEEYVTKVDIWGIDPMPFDILFGSRSGYGFNETRGKQVQEVSTHFNASMDSVKIVEEGQKMGIKPMQYNPLPIQNIELFFRIRSRNDSISNMTRLQKKMELEQLMADSPSFNDKIWKKSFEAECKEILDLFNKDSDRMEEILLSDMDYFTSGTTEYDQFNTVKHFNELNHRIMIPTFVLDEKVLSNLKNAASVTSNMHLSPNEVHIYIGNQKHVFYQVIWKKTKGKWEYRSCERIPLTLSNKLIESGLYGNGEKAETMVMQQDGTVNNLICFKNKKKLTFLDSRRFLNDYQPTISNLK